MVEGNVVFPDAAVERGHEHGRQQNLPVVHAHCVRCTPGFRPRHPERHRAREVTLIRDP